MRRKGFTLIELLVVIAIISALTVAVYVALNPAKRIREANDVRRATDVDSILTAIHQYTVDSKGNLPTGLSTSVAETQLGIATTGCAISTGGCNALATSCVDLSTVLSSYLKSIPVDPLGSPTFTDSTSGYTVAVDAQNLITVRACGTQGTTDIYSSR